MIPRYHVVLTFVYQSYAYIIYIYIYIYTLIAQIKTNLNKGDVFMIGSFLGGRGGTKNIEILGWNSTKKGDGVMNLLS